MDQLMAVPKFWRKFDIAHQANRFVNEALLQFRYLHNAALRLSREREDGTAIIAYKAYAGLGNRMRAHLLAHAIANASGRRILPLWLKTEHLQSDGSDVFAGDDSAKQSFTVRGYLKALRQILRTRALPAAALDATRLPPASGFAQLAFDAQWVKMEKTRSNFSPPPLEWRLSKAVETSANAILETLPRPYLALHFRQGDFKTHLFETTTIDDVFERVCNTQGFSAAKHIAIFSDEAVDITKISFPDKSISVITPQLARDADGVAVEAVAHVIAMARADFFVGHARSSYSELAHEVRSGSIVPIFS